MESYIRPVIEVIELENEDTIITSGSCCDGYTDYSNG